MTAKLSFFFIVFHTAFNVWMCATCPVNLMRIYLITISLLFPLRIRPRHCFRTFRKSSICILIPLSGGPSTRSDKCNYRISVKRWKDKVSENYDSKNSQNECSLLRA
jgi:hypothetical protein